MKTITLSGTVEVPDEVYDALMERERDDIVRRVVRHYTDTVEVGDGYRYVVDFEYHWTLAKDAIA